MTDQLLEFQEYIQEAQTIYLEDIREGNPQAFTRKRKTPPYALVLQMFAQKGNSQFSELLNFYADQEKPLDISTAAFYKAHMDYNLKAIRFMMKDYLSMVYEENDDHLVKLNGYLVTAIDGSDIILPSTEENALKYGVVPNPKASANLVMASVSLLYDFINKLVIDQLIQNGQKFVMRMNHLNLKRYSSQFPRDKIKPLTSPSPLLNRMTTGMTDLFG